MKQEVLERAGELLKEQQNLDTVNQESYSGVFFGSENKILNSTKTIYINFGYSHSPDAYIKIEDKHKHHILDAIKKISEEIQSEIDNLTC